MKRTERASERPTGETKYLESPKLLLVTKLRFGKRTEERDDDDDDG